MSSVDMSPCAEAYTIATLYIIYSSKVIIQDGMNPPFLFIFDLARTFVT